MTESSGQAAEFSGKRALIVDDSKSARAFLSRMLEKHGIEVDTAETAEQAIVYLARTRPDVIFMDHLMPGMDGFQAVQSIKNNPRTATIPIMMFTSQEGELYLGQARALGALGVLPKQVKPAEVSTVLHQLRLVPDRRKARVTSFEPGNAVAHEAFQRPSLVTINGVATGTDGPAPTGAPPLSSPGEATLTLAQLRPIVEDVMRDQLTDLRRALSNLLDDHTERVLGQVRESAGAAHVTAPDGTDPAGEALFASREPPRAPRTPWAIAAGVSLVAAAMALLWWQASQQAQALGTQLAEARATLGARAATANRALPQIDSRTPEPAMPPPSNGPSAVVGAAAGVAPVAGASASTSANAVAGAVASQPVPYGEVPMSGERLEALRRQLEDLVARDFRGTVSVTSYPGRYCLVGSLADGYEAAPADAPLSKCDVLGNPFDEQLGPAQREPLALANLVGSIRQKSGGALDVQLVNGSETQRVAAYPDPAARATAGDWNRAAVANNRLEIRVQPRAP